METMPNTARSKRGGGPEIQRIRAEETRTALIRTARNLFGEVGFHNVGTEQIVLDASVTRGALYHHFNGKEGLFEAVFRQVAQDLNESIQNAVLMDFDDLWATSSKGISLYLKVISENVELQRILFVDSPAVLGWPRWRELQDEYFTPGVIMVLDALMAAKIFAEQPKPPLANLLHAAITDAALSIAHSETPQRTYKEVNDAFLSIFGGLRVEL